MSLLAKFKLKGGQAAPAAPPPRRQDAYDAAQAQQDRQLAREQELEKLANSLGPEFYDDKYDHVRKFLVSAGLLRMLRNGWGRMARGFDNNKHRRSHYDMIADLPAGQ